MSEWADKNRIISGRAAAEPGKWNTDRTPYLRAPMDSLIDTDVEYITLMMAAQSGKTEAMYNQIGYIIDQDPSPTMLVMPREDDRDRTIGSRVRPMVEDTEALFSHLPGGAWDTKKQEFFFDRMTLYFAGANSPAGLASTPIRYLFFDECDKYPEFTGKEASPMALATKRTRTFYDRKNIACCTPTLHIGNIARRWERSNQQRYYCPCPNCGEYSVWEFADLKAPKDERNPDIIRQFGECWIECPICGGKIIENLKDDLVANGVWCPKGQTVNIKGEIEGSPDKSKWHSGYQASALISPWVNWSEIMADWFQANTEEGILKGDIMDFYNSTLGLPFEESGKQVTENALHKKKGEFSQGTVPNGAVLLTAGADYHESNAGVVRIDYEVRAFGYGLRNWVITTGSAANFGDLIEKVIMYPFPWSDPDNSSKELPVIMMLIDSGYKPDAVYNLCADPRFRNLIFPCKGASNRRVKPVTVTNIKNIKRKSRIQVELPLMTVDTEYFKDQVTSWAGADINAPGSTQYYMEIPDQYFKEFTSEHKVKERLRGGREVWHWKKKTTSKATHFLDTGVYAAAAMHQYCDVMNINLLREPGQVGLMPAARAVKPAPVKREFQRSGSRRVRTKY